MLQNFMVFFLRKLAFFWCMLSSKFFALWLATKITLCITDLAINRILFF